MHVDSNRVDTREKKNGGRYPCWLHIDLDKPLHEAICEASKEPCSRDLKAEKGAKKIVQTFRNLHGR